MTPLALRIAGTGPVALAFALFANRLLGREARITMEAPDAPAAPPPALSARPLAISYGSRLLIERVATFPAQAAPIRRIDIALSGLPGRTRLTADELGLPALGWVVRHGRLTQALREAFERRIAVGGTLGTLPAGGQAPAPAAPVHVIADGDPGADADVHAHDQWAVLSEVTASRGPPQLAVERFTPEGPLALLPLPAAAGQPARWALVWCTDPQSAAQRVALPADAFERALQQAFGDAFGELRLAADRAAVPLARRTRRALVRGRTVWIGNAAQSLHPVAGQGLNLGLRDAFELADTLARATQRGEPPETALASYASRRAPDRASMTRITDVLAGSLRAPLARPLQSVALALLDSVPTLRAAVARGFMHGFAPREDRRRSHIESG